ncbi:MAG: DCC1-like thiol-disulfide oxidoreductase family protein [Chitinophagaceae bacterium]|jgi:predicted DCC family thiol-disulfide oxidoreductase YuxK|nr:DCC1-like thiol-disulfide oxidoreductase family protein [Chitinophagaceae bacterium]
MEEELTENNHPIVLFDGVCNYCNNMVNFAIRWNSKRTLRYTPLQSVTAKALLIKYNIPQAVDSLVFIEKNKAYIYSSAALKISKHLNFPINLLYMFIIVPQIIRNPFYRWIAANRYKWFGKNDRCMVPSKEVKELFLD